MIDLHTHTRCSDGSDTPTALIAKAVSAKLSLIALTDHDTVAGWDEARRALRENHPGSGLQVVLGSEISCQSEDGISIHMLGLLFDKDNLDLATVLARTRDNRFTRMERIVEKLNGAGIEITIEDVHAQLSDGATLGRPHLADALVKKGYVASRDEAFTSFLHNKSKYYVSHYSPSPSEAISLIKKAGGVAVIAHPYASLRGRIIKKEDFADLVTAGLDGIEVDHRDHSESEKSDLLRIAYEYDLAITGSSDYHGNGKLNRLAEFTTDPRQWELLEARADQRRVVRE